MRIKNERDFWSGLLFVVVGVAFAFGAASYGMGPACAAADPCPGGLWARFSQLSTQPGAGFFPLGLSILLALLGAVVLFKALTFESEGGDPIGAVAWRPLLAVVASIVLFGAMVEPLGLVVSAPMLVVVSSLACKGVRWKSLLASAVVLTLACWAAVVWGFRLAVPLWPWFVA